MQSIVDKTCLNSRFHGPLTRYVKLRVAHAPGMLGTFSPPPRVRDPDMHHGTCVAYVPWCMSGSLTNGLLWSSWRGKRSRHSRRMPNPQFYLSGKRPMQPIQVISWSIFSNILIIDTPYLASLWTGCHLWVQVRFKFYPGHCSGVWKWF